MSLDKELEFSDSSQNAQARDEQGGTWWVSDADKGAPGSSANFLEPQSLYLGFCSLNTSDQR